MLPTLQAAGYAIGAALMGLIGNLAGFATATSEGELKQVMLVVFSSAAAVAISAFAASIRIVTLLNRVQLPRLE